MFCTALAPGSASLHHPQDARRGSRGGCLVSSWVLSRPRGIGTTGNPPPQPQARAGGAAAAAGRCCKRHIRRNGLGVSTTPRPRKARPVPAPKHPARGLEKGRKGAQACGMSIPGMDPWDQGAQILWEHPCPALGRRRGQGVLEVVVQHPLKCLSPEKAQTWVE